MDLAVFHARGFVIDILSVLETLIGTMATAKKATMVVGDKAVTLLTEAGEAPTIKEASHPVPEPSNMANLSIISMQIFLSYPAM